MAIKGSIFNGCLKIFQHLAAFAFSLAVAADTDFLCKPGQKFVTVKNIDAFC